MARQHRWSLFVASALSLALAACGGGAASGPRTFEEAADLVLEQVVKVKDLEQPTIVFGLPQLLQAGDELHPYEKAGFEPFPEHTKIEEETWFFWIDDAPGAMFVHPNRFVLVSRQTGEVTVQDQEWWPVLNGEGLWTARNDYWDEGNWVFSFQVAPPADLESSQSLAPLGSGFLARQTQSPGSAIVINGWEAGETLQEDMAASADQMHDILTQAGFDTTYLGPKEDSNPDRDGEPTGNARYGWLYRKASEMRPSQTLFIYITGHGGVDKKGEGVIGAVYESLLADTLKAFDPGVHIIVVLDSCHSGSFTNSLTGVADVTITSTDQASPAYGDIDGPPGNRDSNPEDRGLEYTSGFVEDWNQIMDDVSEIRRVREKAERQGFNFWESLAPESHLSAVAKDLANNRGWTGPILVYGQPQTRVAWTPTPAPTPIPQVGDRRVYQVKADVKQDDAGHKQNIGMPASFELQLEWTLSGIKYSAAFPWIPVEGTLSEDGVFEASGWGTVAGYPSVWVSFDGRLKGDSLEGVYGMGVQGGLPSGAAIYYDISGIAAPQATSTPTATPDASASTLDFYSAWNAAFEAQDLSTLLDSLHPAVFDLYGEDACRSYLQSVIVNPTQVEVLGVQGPEDWNWEIDGREVPITGALAVDVAITSGGQTFTRQAHLAQWDDGAGPELRWFTDCGEPLAAAIEASPTQAATASPAPTLTPMPTVDLGELDVEGGPTLFSSTVLLTCLALFVIGGLAALFWWIYQMRQWPSTAIVLAEESLEIDDGTYQLKTEKECDAACYEVRAAIRRPHRIQIVEVKALTLHKKTGRVIDENVIPGRLADEQNILREFSNIYDVPANRDGVGQEFLYRDGRCPDGCKCEVTAGAQPSRRRRTSRRLHFTFVKDFFREMRDPIVDPKTGQPVMPDPNFMTPEQIEALLSDADLLLPHQPGQRYRVKTTVRYEVTMRVPVELRKYDGRCKPFRYDPSSGHA